jgi:hypothetical protein
VVADYMCLRYISDLANFSLQAGVGWLELGEQQTGLLDYAKQIVLGEGTCSLRAK